MIINHNMAAMNTHRQLGSNNAAAANNIEKLSSGLKINRAGDDAAGLAISEKMRGQIRGLDMASKNSQDAISLVQTAEGSLNETHDILQRMRELAVQSSNDTNTETDRKEIQKEMNQLSEEVDRISSTTEFNTKKLLDGSVGNTANVAAGTDDLKLKSVEVADSKLAADTYTVTTANPAVIGTDVKTNTSGIDTGVFDFTDATNIAGLELGDYTISVKAGVGTGAFDVELKDANGVSVASLAGGKNDADIVLVGKDGEKFNIGIQSDLAVGEMSFNLNATYETADDFSIKNAAGNTSFTSDANLKITGNEFEAGGIKFNMTVDTALAAAGDSIIKTTNDALTMHIGSNEAQTMKIDINKMDTKSLGISGVDVSSQAGSEKAITNINSAIEKVSAERSKLGAVQNRLEHTINNLGTSSENLTAAESRIRDVDYVLAA